MEQLHVIMRNSCQLFPVCIYDGTYVCHRCNMVPFQNLCFFLSASVQKIFEAHILATFFFMCGCSHESYYALLQLIFCAQLVQLLLYSLN